MWRKLPDVQAEKTAKNPVTFVADAKVLSLKLLGHVPAHNLGSLSQSSGALISLGHDLRPIIPLSPPTLSSIFVFCLSVSCSFIHLPLLSSIFVCQFHLLASLYLPAARSFSLSISICLFPPFCSLSSCSLSVSSLL